MVVCASGQHVACKHLPNTAPIRVVMSCVIFYILSLSLQICLVECKKKDVLKGSTDLLEKVSQRLHKEKIHCPYKESELHYMLDNLRASTKSDHALACHIAYLTDTNNLDGWAWSSLGQVFLDRGSTKAAAQAATCFKQAAKFDGGLTKFVGRWFFLGPFVIGKGEVDGDPVAAAHVGGIRNASQWRFAKKDQPKFYSELAAKGEITWSELKQSRADEYIRIAPQVNWNDLVNSLGSTAITEWQGWLLGDFAVNGNNVMASVQCMGTHTLLLDGIPLAGDVYRRDAFRFSAPLSKGIHTIAIRLRATNVHMVKCNLDTVASSVEMLKPHYIPDLYDGYLFSQHLYIPINNLHTTKFVKITKVSHLSQIIGDRITPRLLSDQAIVIAPGQVLPVIVELYTETPKVTPSCEDIELGLKFTTSEGTHELTLMLRCRRKGESFVFTFLDHDGSVQHGALLEPLEPCSGAVCPTLLTLHGTTVPAQNQADSYKRGVGGKFVFGLEKAWILAPTRHGAHNWEGPGALTALAALEAAAALTSSHDWIINKASSEHVIFAGHSMGGHGAWHLGTHYPDLALALVSLAGWNRKEEYGDSNLFYRHDISGSHVDPAVKQILEACITENEVDRHVSNLHGIAVLTRIGASDRTIHPYFVRRMRRLLKQADINVTYVELEGKEHWWWDTLETNDGGCVNDRQLRDFTNAHAVIPPASPASPHCSRDSSSGELCSEEDDSSKKSSIYGGIPDSVKESFTYAVVNPAFGGSMRGLQILRQGVPFRTATAKVETSGGETKITTSNVVELKITEPNNRPMNWFMHTSIQLDDTLLTETQIFDVLNLDKTRLCKVKGGNTWELCGEADFQFSRALSQHGPTRRIAERQFLIVIGTQGDSAANQLIQQLAVYLGNLFFLTSDTRASIVADRDLTSDVADAYNLIILGSPSENSLTPNLLEKTPINFTKDGEVLLGHCNYGSARNGILSLAPHGDDKLALVLMGTSKEALLDIISLATPTIPPMTRSPFSNMVPDFVVTGSDYEARGHAGYQCTGFWGHNWELRPELVSCAYCV